MKIRTFLSKYIYGINNPVVFSDPSGMSILSGVIDAFLQAGHDFIATFGAGLDQFVKSDAFFVIFVIVASIVTPSVVFSAAISASVDASRTGDWSFSTFKNNFYRSYVTSFVVSYGLQGFNVGAGPFGPITLQGTGGSLISSLFIDQYSYNEKFRNQINAWVSQAASAIINTIQSPPRPDIPRGF